MTKKTILNFDDVCALVQILKTQLELAEFKPDIIVPLVRGGTVPGVMLSHLLDVPVQCLGWYTRDTSDLVGSESNCWLPEYVLEGKRVLIVDDIVDTGRTIKEVLSDWNTSVVESLNNRHNLKIACLHERHDAEHKPDYSAVKLDNDNWVVYPWENLNGNI